LSYETYEPLVPVTTLAEVCSFTHKMLGAEHFAPIRPRHLPAFTLVP
jgi:hypothetical protein